MAVIGCCVRNGNAPGDVIGGRVTLSERDVREAGTRSGPEPQPTAARPARWSFLRKVGRHLATLGPFALIFGTYSLLVDHLPDQWFKQDWVRYAFAVLAALCVGVALQWLVRRPGVERAIGANTAASAMLPGPRQPQRGTHPSVRQILDGTRNRLLADLRTSQGDRGELYGWSQFMGEKFPPSAIGTSYGLRIALALDIRDSRLDRRRLVENIVSLQRPAGGWIARSQQDVARPEVTSWVLTALVRAGLDPTLRNEIVGQLERMMTPEVDSVGWQHVSVITSAISALAEVAPTSAKLAELTSHLVDGATEQNGPNGPKSLAWGLTVKMNPGESPSVPHTARAVVALHKAAQVAERDRREELDETIDAGIEWLSHNQSLDVTDEQLRRPTSTGATDTIIIGHFTSAWVARALMCRSTRDRLPQLRRAVGAVLELQENGVWKWRQQRKEPTWMTYQGVLVLRDYSMLNLPWPP